MMDSLPNGSGVTRSWTQMLSDHTIDSARPLRVVCIGGGTRSGLPECVAGARHGVDLSV